MAEFPSKIASVKLIHFMCIMMENRISNEFLIDALEEAERRTNIFYPYNAKSMEREAKNLANKF